MNSGAFGGRGGKVGPATSNWSEKEDESNKLGVPPSGAIAVRYGVFSDDDEIEQSYSSTVNEMQVNGEESVVESDDVEDEEDETSEDSSNTDDSACSSLLVDEFDLCPEVEETPDTAVPCETGYIDEYNSREGESSVGFDDTECFVKEDSTAVQSFEEAIALAASQEAECLTPLDDDWPVMLSDDEPEDMQSAGVAPVMIEQPGLMEFNSMTPATAAESDGSGNDGQMKDTPVERHYLVIHAPEGPAEAAPSTHVDTHDLRISEAWMRVAEETADNWGVVESLTDVYGLYSWSDKLTCTTLSDDLNTDPSVHSDLDDLLEEGGEFFVDPLTTETEPSIEAEPAIPDPVFEEDPSLTAGVEDWEWMLNELVEPVPSDEDLPCKHFPELEEPVHPDEQDDSFMDVTPLRVQWDQLETLISKRPEPAEVESHPETNVEHVTSDSVKDEVEAPRNDPPAPPGTPEWMGKPKCFESTIEKRRFWATWYRFQAINKRRVKKELRKLDTRVLKGGLLCQINDQGNLSSRDAAEALDDERKLPVIEQQDSSQEEAERMEVELVGMSSGTSGQEGQDAGSVPQLSLREQGISTGILVAEQRMHAPMHRSGNSVPQISDGIPGSSREHAERGKKRKRQTDYETDEDDPRRNRKPRKE